jgi:hypothetical protein
MTKHVLAVKKKAAVSVGDKIHINVYHVTTSISVLTQSTVK